MAASWDWNSREKAGAQSAAVPHFILHVSDTAHAAFQARTGFCSAGAKQAGPGHTQGSCPCHCRSQKGQAWTRERVLMTGWSQHWGCQVLRALVDRWGGWRWGLSCSDDPTAPVSSSHPGPSAGLGVGSRFGLPVSLLDGDGAAFLLPGAAVRTRLCGHRSAFSFV